MKQLLLALLIAACCLPTPGAHAGNAPGLAIKDLNGATVRPLASRGRKATVLFFIAHDCPISNGYAPEISRICREYAAKGVALYAVYVDPTLAPAAARAHARAFGYVCPGLLDPQHRLVKRAGATVTPEAAVFGPGGKLIYHGRIDDRYPSLGRRREVVTTHELRASLDAMLSGKPVPVAATKAVGCFIPPAG